VATVMTFGTIRLFEIHVDPDFYILVFFSTLSSYCLHWYFTIEDLIIEHKISEIRLTWNSKYKRILLLLFIISLFIIGFVFLIRPKWIFFFIPTAIATLIYTAPKLPIPVFKKLEGKALAKTFYLTTIWTYVTCILPLQVSAVKINELVVFYISCQFLFIYLICLLFDYRDHKKDNLNFILINTNKHFNKIFYLVSALFILILSVFYFSSHKGLMTLGLLIGFLTVYSTLKKSINTRSDYWYYFNLDGLMAVPAIVYTLLTFLLNN
jgi:hypothetical protein